jgi:hypothetical protein
LFQRQIDIIKGLDHRQQYQPLIENFLKNQSKLRLDKCIGKQMKPLQYIPFSWVDTKETLETSITEITAHLKDCNLLAVDLEYHNFAKVNLKFLISVF